MPVFRICLFRHRFPEVVPRSCTQSVSRDSRFGHDPTRADEQLAETQEQLAIVCQALINLGKDDSRTDVQSRSCGEAELPPSSAQPSVANVQQTEALSLVPTPPARCDEVIAAETDGFPAQVAPPPTTTVGSVEEKTEKRCGVGSSSTITTAASLRVASVSVPGATTNAAAEPAETTTELAIVLDLEDGRVEHTPERGRDAPLASIDPTVPVSALCSAANQSVGRSMQADENPLGQPDVDREAVPASKGMPKRGDSFCSAPNLPLNAAADRKATPAADLPDATNIHSGATGKAPGTREGLDETQGGIRAAVDESPQRDRKLSLSSAEVGFLSAVSVKNDDYDKPVVQSLQRVPADNGNSPAPERKDNARPLHSGLETSPSSAGGFPTSSRRRRSSDALFGLPRLTSMNTIRQERQEQQEKQNQEVQQQNLLQEGKSNTQLLEHAIHAAAGLRAGKTTESGRNTSLRDSPPPSGRVATGHARLGTQGEREEETRQPPEPGTGTAALVAGRSGERPDTRSFSRPSRGDATTSEMRIGRLGDPSGSPSSSPESRDGEASSGKMKPERGRLLQRHEPPQGRSLSSPAAERGQSVTLGEDKQQPTGQPPRTCGGETQFESAAISSGNCGKHASRGGTDAINATGAAAAVRSRHQQRGRSSGLLSSLRSGIAEKSMSRKNRGGGSGRIRSESPEARRG